MCVKGDAAATENRLLNLLPEIIEVVDLAIRIADATTSRAENDLDLAAHPY